VFKQLRPEIGLGLGVIDIKATVIESADSIARAIERAENLLGPGRVSYVTPIVVSGCSSATLPMGRSERWSRAAIAMKDAYLARDVSTSAD
jgi:5-methyltetrahydropteroyltriglutamate--homocysteine methyltransferase